MNPSDSSAEWLEADGFILRRKSNVAANGSTVPACLEAWLSANEVTFAITFGRYNPDANIAIPLQARLAA
jgi:hypothetical protein